MNLIIDCVFRDTSYKSFKIKIKVFVCGFGFFVLTQFESIAEAARAIFLINCYEKIRKSRKCCMG